MSHPTHPPASPARQQQTLSLVRQESIGNAYHMLVFDAPLGPEAQPGQFAMIRGQDWGTTPLLPRPMSYVSGGKSPTLLVKVVGDGTRRLAQATPGDRYALLGPLGNSWRAPAPKAPVVLVAGGVGVAPLLFLARSLQRKGHQVLAIYGGRTHRDLPLSDQLSDVAELHLVTEDGSQGQRGRVTDLLADLLEPNTNVYSCGPHGMMAKVAEICERRQVRCDVSLEAPMACGYGVCLGCAVPARSGGYLYACTEGPCLDAHLIDWIGEQPGPRTGTQA